MATEPVGAASTLAKAADVVRNWPVWLFFAIAASLAVFVSVPAFRNLAPAPVQTALVFATIVAWLFTLSRAAVHVIEYLRSRENADSKRMFVVTPVDHQVHWSIADQQDGSAVTQVLGHFMVKNRGTEPLHLMRAKLIRPRIKGPELPGLVTVRHTDSHMHGSAFGSGSYIPPGATLPAHITLLYRGVPRQQSGTLKAVLEFGDADGKCDRIKVMLAFVGPPRKR